MAELWRLRLVCWPCLWVIAVASCTSDGAAPGVGVSPVTVSASIAVDVSEPGAEIAEVAPIAFASIEEVGRFSAVVGTVASTRVLGSGSNDEQTPDVILELTLERALRGVPGTYAAVLFPREARLLTDLREPLVFLRAVEPEDGRQLAAGIGEPDRALFVLPTGVTSVMSMSGESVVSSAPLYGLTADLVDLAEKPTHTEFAVGDIASVLSTFAEEPQAIVGDPFDTGPVLTAVDVGWLADLEVACARSRLGPGLDLTRLLGLGADARPDGLSPADAAAALDLLGALIPEKELGVQPEGLSPELEAIRRAALSKAAELPGLLDVAASSRGDAFRLAGDAFQQGVHEFAVLWVGYNTMSCLMLL